MSESTSRQDASLTDKWRKKIEVANQNNIFCHCRSCDYEWVDSSVEVSCKSCGGKNIERIACWQFPDG